MPRFNKVLSENAREGKRSKTNGSESGWLSITMPSVARSPLRVITNATSRARIRATTLRESFTLPDDTTRNAVIPRIGKEIWRVSWHVEQMGKRAFNLPTS
jgi:hypothetical protein